MNKNIVQECEDNFKDIYAPDTGSDIYCRQLKRKNLLFDIDMEIDLEVARFRDSPEYKNSHCLIYPDDKCKTVWDLFIVFLIFYTITYYIFRFAFYDTDKYYFVILEYLIDFCFFIDCCIAFFTCYYTNSSELVIDHKSIVVHYIKSWFFVDLLGFFPYEVFTNNRVGNSKLFSEEMKPLYRILRVCKLFRMLKVWNNPLKIQELKEFILSLKIPLSRMTLLLVSFILFCHLMTCLWCLLPRSYYDLDNWEFVYNIQDSSIYEKYLAGFYWLITTVCTIGYGDIAPRNDLEIAIAICVMSGGVFFYSYTISSITSLIAKTNSQNTKIEESIGILSGIAIEYKLSKQFHKRLQDALVYNLKEKRTDFQTLINSLPPKVASMLKYKMNHKLIENNIFFTDKPFHFVQRILEFLNPYKAEAEEYVYKKGAPVDEIYFVLSGHVAFIYEKDIIYESVQAGGYFGDAEIFLCEKRETCVKCIKRTKMLTLERDSLLGVLKEYEKVKVDMIFASMIKRKQLKNTSIASRSETESQDIYITPEQNTAKESKSVDVSANFILDCSSSLEPKLAWD
ncbi:hypothetical protein SteCoe_9440 [Stentor coeruleus]|uniref:Cyclic nucleotide-binding domain-containing protein n=1 Tax=Stentor coeruleus TaxID=5963 RepID=A0A1R2CHV2_9CILI|nr:hypothetical protein SteCoe_9440 [Stentor coeruleus]